ncbi:unnamed protein product [Plutella xylostella]|uniref:(diamondback moth) hypothetical protein n=1 Tax=Plutella xylostella TaxID=51655 RepID=A0A8S4G8T9_PLUXY|nr:unnamed protein product [Plutella xylostella]
MLTKENDSAANNYDEDAISAAAPSSSDDEDNVVNDHDDDVTNSAAASSSGDDDDDVVNDDEDANSTAVPLEILRGNDEDNVVNDDVDNDVVVVADWLTVTWAQGGMPLQGDGAGDALDSVRGRCGRAGSLAANPGEKLLELLRPSSATPRRHSTAACAPPAAPQPRPAPAHAPPRGFVYCPSDALPYCPPSRLAPPPAPIIKVTAVLLIGATSTTGGGAPARAGARGGGARAAGAAARAPAPRLPAAAPPRAATHPPRPVQNDQNGNMKRTVAPVSPQPRLDCNRNPQPLLGRRLQRSQPEAPYIAPVQTGPPPRRSPSAGSNISVRQDSNVSSDSFSQTSSPSYTTKTMETPLLPHQSVNKSLNAKIARQLLLKEAAEAQAGAAGAGGAGGITKSASTPAALQTIVRLQAGSNLSLHHRMLRDMRAGAGSAQRFRLLQLALNAVALLAISAALFAYFQANPAVQVSLAVLFSCLGFVEVRRRWYEYENITGALFAYFQANPAVQVSSVVLFHCLRVVEVRGRCQQDIAGALIAYF